MHADEEAFLAQIESDDPDDVARLVFADWLEERGDARAEFVRLEAALHALGPRARGPDHFVERRRFAALAQTIDPDWRRRVERVRGLGLPELPPREPEPPRVVAPPAAAPPAIWSRLSATAEPDGRSVTAARLGVCALLFFLALGASSCVFETHLVCRGGAEGACSIDTYGVFTRVRHVDLPVREIVEVAVDERVPRRGPGSATVEILTRTRGRIDLAGGQLVTSRFSQNDAADAARALRQLPKDVDLWVGSGAGAAVIPGGLVLLWLYVVGGVVRRLHHARARRDAHLPA